MARFIPSSSHVGPLRWARQTRQTIANRSQAHGRGNSIALRNVVEASKEVDVPEISRKGSKKKKGKKGKKSQQIDDEPATPPTFTPELDLTAAEQPLQRQDTYSFFDTEAQRETGAMGPEPVSEVIASAPAIHRTDTDTFWQEEADF